MKSIYLHYIWNGIDGQLRYLNQINVVNICFGNVSFNWIETKTRIITEEVRDQICNALKNKIANRICSKRMEYW